MNVEAGSSYTEQPKLIRLLDLSFAALTILAVAGVGIYFVFLEPTLQNIYSTLIVAFFAVLTLFFRAKAMESPDDYERLKRIFRFWLLTAIVGLVFGLFIILTYPI